MKYYTLSNGYTGTATAGDWLIECAPWADCNFPMTDTEVEAWNPRMFARSWYHGGVRAPKPDFPIVLGEWQAVSARLKQALSDLSPDSFRFLPFRTRDSIGEDLCDEYSLLHYLHWVDAIDRRRATLLAGETRFKKVGGRFGNYLLDHVVLSQRKLTLPICRIVGWTEFHIYREDIVTALTERALTGLHFEEVATA
jgi:hypothetical protein